MKKTERPSCWVPGLNSRAGRSYEIAFVGMSRAPEWQLVHGECNGPPNVGRLGHAWLEHADQVFPAADYRRIYGAVELARYALKDAAQLVAQSGHYGPWASDTRLANNRDTDASG